MHLTEQEQQLIECIREWQGNEDFSVNVAVESGAWEVKLTAGKKTGRGVGRTFAAAWDDVTGLKF